MSCKPFKTSEANAKAFLKTKGVIDNLLNIKDLNAFRKENAILKEQAKNKYFPNVKGWNEKIFFENREGTKAIPNKKVFKQIDNINGVYYQQNEPMYSEIYNEQTKNTLLKSRKNIPISKVDIDKLNIPTNVKNYLKWLSENKKDKLKSFSDLINFVYNNDFKNEYYSLFTKQVNPELEKKLTDFLKQFYFDIEETTLSKLKKEFGLNILGVTDIINKTIKVVNENERNVLTLPEEISHAVFELLGSHYKNSPIAKQLYKTVSSWEGYKTIYNEYADIYKNADGTTDWKKVQKEAIGKALAMALVNYNSQSYTNLPLEVKLIIDKIVSYVRQLLGMFSKDIRKLEKNIQFKNLINEIARKVLNNDSDYFKTYNDEGFSTTDYIETLEEQTKEDGGKVVKLMKIVSENGGAITGSLSLRKVGVLKRGKEGLLHDIDTIFNDEELFGLPIARQLTQREFENTKVFNDLKKEYGDSLNYFTNWMHSNENYNAFHYYITSPEINQKIQQKKDEGMFISEIYESLTEEEKKETILIDVFIMPNKLKFVHDDVYDINLSTPEYSYLPKLFVMGRNKDVYDYQNLKYFNDKFKIDDQRNFLYQVQKETTETKKDTLSLTIEKQIDDLIRKGIIKSKCD